MSIFSLFRKSNLRFMEGAILLVTSFLIIAGFLIRSTDTAKIEETSYFSVSTLLVAALFFYLTGFISSIICYKVFRFSETLKNRFFDLSIIIFGISILIPVETLKTDDADMYIYWSFLGSVISGVVLYCTTRSLLRTFFTKVMTEVISLTTAILASIAIFFQDLYISTLSIQDQFENNFSNEFVDLYAYLIISICIAVWVSYFYYELQPKFKKKIYQAGNLYKKEDQSLLYIGTITFSVVLNMGLQSYLSYYLKEPYFLTLYLLGIFLSIYCIFSLIKLSKKNIDFIIHESNPISNQNLAISNYNVNLLNSSVGMRSANFFIDHDPDDIISSHFLHTISQIRSIEIHRNVSEILGDKLFCERTIKNQIFGSVNPSYSNRPCIDVLNMFATMYLIALPSVNQRIRNLIRLLPIIDPEIKDIISLQDVDKLNKDVEWLFHFDYNWIDQQIFVSSHHRKYSVDIDNMKLSTRYKILAYLHKRIPMGNFIWIGETARTRIIMEAPFLANIIETWPISLEENESEVVFLIKFYDLIPRLKKYYSLDSKLEIIKAYEPTFESQRFVSSMNKKIDKISNPKQMETIISEIKEFSFVGYTEKDSALELILDLYKICLDKSNTSKSQKNIWESIIFKKLKPALSKIGYPNQVPHRAQLSKRFIRDPFILMDICLKPSNERFSEAWLFLASVNPGIYSASQRQELLKLILRAANNKKIVKDAKTMKKIIEAFFNISSLSGKNSISLIQEIINSILGYLAICKPEPELIMFFLDAKIFLEEQIKSTFYFKPENIVLLKQHIAKLSDCIGKNSPDIVSLKSRWDLLMAQIDVGSNKAAS